MKQKIFLKTLLASAALFLVFSPGVKAAIESQCATGSGTEGAAQTQCSPATDSQVLAQCQTQFPGQCGNVSSYLSALAASCNQAGIIGYDCSTITQGGYYGREAARWANYLERNSNSNSLPVDTSGTPPGDRSLSGTSAAPDLLADVKNKGLPDPAGGIKAIATNLLKWLLEIVGVLALIAFVVSGTQYLLASADEKLAEKAKQNMTYSVIGVIVVLSSLVIIKALDAILSAKSLF